MNREPNSTAVRYILARLRPLGRPIFWGPAIALLLLTLFTWDFWAKDFVPTATKPEETDEPVSKSDRSIGVDIDSLPVLFNDMKDKPSPSPAASPKPGATPIASQSPNPTKSAEAAPTDINTLIKNALANKANNAAPAQAAANGATSESGSSSSTSVVPFTMPTLSSTNRSTSTPSNGLQEAMSARIRPAIAPSSPATPSVIRTPSPSLPIEGSAPLPNSGINASPNPSYSTSTPALQEGSQPLPAPTHYPGTIAPPMAPAPRLNPSIPSLNPANPIVAPNAGLESVTPAQPEVTPQPFSVPREVPGRSIGGGNINTFSNP